MWPVFEHEEAFQPVLCLSRWANVLGGFCERCSCGRGLEGVPVLRGKMPCWEGATGVVPTGLLCSLDMPALLVGPQLLSLS